MRILGQRSADLVELLVQREGFDVPTGRRFVVAVGNDLVKSHEWLGAELHGVDLTLGVNIRRLLAFIHTNSIASTVGVSRSRAWSGVRTIVPRMLRMAGGEGSLRATAPAYARVRPPAPFRAEPSGRIDVRHALGR